MDSQVQDFACHPELIAAYVDGDLETAARSALENHIHGCSSCANELRMQRLFMCELDVAFAEQPQLEMPRDFARIVAVQAESDMSGARSGTEHKKALHFCLILAALSFTLLGSAAGRSLLTSGQHIAGRILGVAGLLGKTLYDAGSGFSVVMRVAGGVLSPDAFAVLVFLVLLLAVLVLSILIAGYHRYPRRGLFE